MSKILVSIKTILRVLKASKSIFLHFYIPILNEIVYYQYQSFLTFYHTV